MPARKRSSLSGSFIGTSITSRPMAVLTVGGAAYNRYLYFSGWGIAIDKIPIRYPGVSPGEFIVVSAKSRNFSLYRTSASWRDKISAL